MKDGLLDVLKRALSERMLSAELDEHLESESAEGAINRRNGTSRKTVLTETSKLTLAIPRDRTVTFADGRLCCQAPLAVMSFPAASIAALWMSAHTNLH